MTFAPIILNDGNPIPQIAFGTGTALYGRDAETSVAQAIEGGFNHIDTAEKYNNEESVGRAIRESGLARSELFITTKYGGGGPIREAFELSLNKLGVTYVDLFLIHFPTDVQDIPTAWKEFEKIKDAGLAKSIGVSNFSVQDLEILLQDAKVVPAVNQIRFHLYNYKENVALLSFANKHGIVVEAYSPLTPITKSPGGPVDAVTERIGARIGATPAQVILSWVKSKDIVIVTTTSRKERLQEYLAVGDLSPLTADDIRELEAAGAKGPKTTTRRVVDIVVDLAFVAVGVRGLVHLFA